MKKWLLLKDVGDFEPVGVNLIHSYGNMNLQ